MTERESLFRGVSDAELERRWRQHLDWADESDDSGAHVGIARYHRERAREIADEQRLRASICDDLNARQA